MQAFKIENFLRENPGSPPLQFVPLTESEECQVGRALLLRTGGPNGTPNEALGHLLESSEPMAGVDLDQQRIGLREVFCKCGITPAPTVYVEWGPLCEIDRFQIEDLFKHFWDVWYPSADDIEIFDDTFDWIVFVRHYGGVEVWRAREPGGDPGLPGSREGATLKV